MVNSLVAPVLKRKTVHAMLVFNYIYIRTSGRPSTVSWLQKPLTKKKKKRAWMYRQTSTGEILMGVAS